MKVLVQYRVGTQQGAESLHTQRPESPGTTSPSPRSPSPRSCGGGHIHVISRDQSKAFSLQTIMSHLGSQHSTQFQSISTFTLPANVPSAAFPSPALGQVSPSHSGTGAAHYTNQVRACWHQLFTLGLTQCGQGMVLSTTLMAIINHLQNSIQEDKFSGNWIK